MKFDIKIIEQPEFDGHGATISINGVHARAYADDGQSLRYDPGCVNDIWVTVPDGDLANQLMPRDPSLSIISMAAFEARNKAGELISKLLDACDPKILWGRDKIRHVRFLRHD